MLFIIQLVKTEIMARTVLFFVPQTVKRVDTQTDCALARRDGKEKIVLKVMRSNTFKIYIFRNNLISLQM